MQYWLTLKKNFLGDHCCISRVYIFSDIINFSFSSKFHFKFFLVIDAVSYNEIRNKGLQDDFCIFSIISLTISGSYLLLVELPILIVIFPVVFFDNIDVE